MSMANVVLAAGLAALPVIAYWQYRKTGLNGLMTLALMTGVVLAEVIWSFNRLYGAGNALPGAFLNDRILALPWGVFALINMLVLGAWIGYLRMPRRQA